MTEKGTKVAVREGEREKELPSLFYAIEKKESKVLTINMKGY